MIAQFPRPAEVNLRRQMTIHSNRLPYATKAEAVLDSLEIISILFM